jgi:lipoprotein-releasing system ATP-binding protein
MDDAARTPLDRSLQDAGNQLAGSRPADGAATMPPFGLANRATHRPGELSGGEQQRVALARALHMNPKLLLPDEPTGNLDSGTSKSIHDLFFEINERHGTTIVIVTHNNELAQSMPRIVTLKDGKLHSDERLPRRPRPAVPVETVV